MSRAIYTLAFALIAAAAIAVGVPVIASSNPRPVDQRPAAESIAAGTTLAASRSVTFYPGRGSGESYGLAMLYTTITDDDDTEDGVTLHCYGLRHGGSTDYVIPACPWDSTNVRYNCDDTAVGNEGLGAVQYWNPSDESAAATKSRVFRIDVEGFTTVTCTYDFNNGAAGDTVEVLVDVATKG